MRVVERSEAHKLMAVGAALRPLFQGQRELSWLMWSLVASAYAFTLGVLLRGVAEVRGFQPTGPILNWLAFLANMGGILGSLLGVALVVRSGYAALRRPTAGSKWAPEGRSALPKDPRHRGGRVCASL